MSNGLNISPIKGKDDTNQPRSLRDAVNAIDNEKDFSNYISSYGSKVPPRSSEIKYERNPVSCTNNLPLAIAHLNLRFSIPRSPLPLLRNANHTQQRPIPLAKALLKALRKVLAPLPNLPLRPTWASRSITKVLLLLCSHTKEVIVRVLASLKVLHSSITMDVRDLWDQQQRSVPWEEL